MTIPTQKPVEKNKFVRVVNSRGQKVSGLYRRNNRLYFQTRVEFSESPIKIPLAADNLREADKEIIETKAKLNKGWLYQGARWVEPGQAVSVEAKATTNGGKEEGKDSTRLTKFSLPDVFKKWLETKQTRVRPSSFQCSEDDLNAWLEAFRKLEGFENEESQDIRNVDWSHITDILDRWETAKGANRTSRYRMKKRLATLRRVFRWLKAKRIIEDIPWDSDDASEWIGEVEEEQFRPLITKEQAENVIKAARADKGERGHPSFGGVLADILDLISYTGLRRIEAFSLRWRQIDFENKRVVVEKEKKQQRGVQRAIPFVGQGNQGSKEAESFLKKLANEAKKRGEYHPDGFVFVGRKLDKEGKPTHVKNLRGLLIRIAERVGLKNFAYDRNRAEKELRQSPHLGFHDFRRFFITKCVNSGVEENIIATWVGHKDGGRLIRETYTKYDQSVGREMAKLVKY